MTNERPIIISKISWIMYLMVGFVMAMGIMIYQLVGLDKMISSFNDSRITFGLTLMFLISLFFILPLILLLFLKKIKIFKSRLVISYPFRLKNQIVDFDKIDSFMTYEGDARGITFTEISIKLKNGHKIKFNSISNTNFKKCISILNASALNG